MKRIQRHFIWAILALILVIILVFLLISRHFDSSETAYVKRVIDGDTIVLSNGSHVRYIGIDCPEMNYDTDEPQFQAVEATHFNEKLVLGKTVRLEYGIDRYDEYGRTLAYVFMGDTFVNEALVKAGLARARTYYPNYKYQKVFNDAELQARQNKVGIWSKR